MMLILAFFIDSKGILHDRVYGLIGDTTVNKSSI